MGGGCGLDIRFQESMSVPALGLNELSAPFSLEGQKYVPVQTVGVLTRSS